MSRRQPRTYRSQLDRAPAVARAGTDHATQPEAARSIDTLAVITGLGERREVAHQRACERSPWRSTRRAKACSETLTRGVQRRASGPGERIELAEGQPGLRAADRPVVVRQLTGAQSLSAIANWCDPGNRPCRYEIVTDQLLVSPREVRHHRGAQFGFVAQPFL
jgi:hypothetical protein